MFFLTVILLAASTHSELVYDWDGSETFAFLGVEGFGSHTVGGRGG